MLRGSSRTLEQVADTTGAVAPFPHRIQDVVAAPPSPHTTALLAEQTTPGDLTSDGASPHVLAATQLYPFATEQASGGDGVELPLDPLDPTWGRPSDRDRTLTAGATALAAAFDELPSRVLQSNAHTLVSAGGTDLQPLPLVAVVAGLLVFVVAGVAVNRTRRRLAKKQKAFDDDDEGDSNASDAYAYALFS